MSSTQPRRRKHLMTPGQPRATRPEPMSVTLVQKWVMSALAVTTIGHLAAGLVVAAAYADRLDAKIGLIVIAGAFGVIAVAAALLIHQRRALSPWLLVGLLPTLVGALIVL